MKRLILLLILLMSFVTTFTQEPKKFATCKVIEQHGNVDVIFSQDVRYLGVDYEKDVLYFDRKKLKFNDGQEAVSYLSTAWSWVLCGNPTQLKDGAIMWVMRHEVENNIANFTRNIRAFEEAQKRYYNNEYDNVYYDGESH